VDVDRFNPVMVDFYRQLGFLPEALLNYLLLLGWSLDDETEIFSRQQMINTFSLDRVNKAPASFDPAKLLAFQGKWMRKLDLKKKVALCVPYLQRAGLVESPPSCELAPRLGQLLEAAGDRVKVAGDILQFADFYTPDDAILYDQKAFAKRLGKPGASELLGRLRERLAELDPFEATECEEAVKSFVASENIKIEDIIHALRVAVTGKAVGLGMFETLAILGKESALRRLDRALEQCTSEGDAAEGD
jgi:glutamyl-tRNA synthetase